MRKHQLLLSVLLPLTAASGFAQVPAEDDHRGLGMVRELDDGTILAVDPTGTYTFATWTDYVASEYFLRNGRRCGQPDLADVPAPAMIESTAHCTSSLTDPAHLADYAPSGPLYDVPVVFHVLQHPNGNGNVTDANIHEQIDVLNEDFLALNNSNGAGGTDVNVQFHLATVDPNGQPTNGINRYVDRKWYNDRGNYASAISWDTNRYLNVYTNTAGGNLGYAYVPNGGGVVGASFDGVRLLWSAVGKDAPIGPPYDQGRTATHEVGHYLGLYHTFDGGCHDPTPNNCYSLGDLICDTNTESSPNYSTCSRTTCGSPDPVRNYMDYSEDLCMDNFTPEQARRVRCTLENWRTELISTGPANSPPSVSIEAPANGTTVNDGTSLTFTGVATDVEDGSLTGSISWASDLDGSLGTGASVAATLSVGTHTISASAVDSGGLSGSDSISVTVNPVGGGNITLNASTVKVRGRTTVTLTWSGATGNDVVITRNGVPTTTDNDGNWVDPVTYRGGGTIVYQLDADNGMASITVVY